MWVVTQWKHVIWLDSLTMNRHNNTFIDDFRSLFLLIRNASQTLQLGFSTDSFRSTNCGYTGQCGGTWLLLLLYLQLWGVRNEQAKWLLRETNKIMQPEHFLKIGCFYKHPLTSSPSSTGTPWIVQFLRAFANQSHLIKHWHWEQPAGWWWIRMFAIEIVWKGFKPAACSLDLKQPINIRAAKVNYFP